MSMPTIPRWPNAASGSTVSYAGPRADEIAERLPRHRAQHAVALQAARAARARGDMGAHVRALRNAELARLHLRMLHTSARALAILWHDRTWFYFDDPEYARRRALLPEQPMPRYHPARSRGEDDRYLRDRRRARNLARRQARIDRLS